ncbi:MAG: glycosyl hydrolase family 18 protein [Bacteroidota bacterium]
MIRILIVFLLFCCSCQSQPVVESNKKDSAPFRVVGFYKGNGSDIDKYEFEKLTHLIFCFTYLQGNKINIKNTEDEETLKRCVALKAKYPKLKVLISFGGWGGCETCSDVFATDSGRNEFAISVKNLLEKYTVDGIDLDWESPVIGGYKNHKASKNDKANFTSLVKELRKTLPAKSEICFDANSFKEFLELSIDWKEVMPLVDFVNLMTYGLPSNERGHTGHHSALYSSSYQSESIDKSIRALDSLNVQLNKILIGAAFYSFVAENVDSINNGLGRKGKFKTNVNYNKLVESYTQKEGYDYYWDSIAQAPYLYNKQQKIFVTFDNEKSVEQKTKYAIKNKLGGIMFWKLNGDSYSNGLLNAIDKEIKINSN